MLAELRERRHRSPVVHAGRDLGREPPVLGQLDDPEAVFGLSLGLVVDPEPLVERESVVVVAALAQCDVNRGERVAQLEPWDELVRLTSAPPAGEPRVRETSVDGEPGRRVVQVGPDEPYRRGKGSIVSPRQQVSSASYSAPSKSGAKPWRSR